MKLEELHRRVQADPDDARAQVELLSARARIEGSDVYLEVLRDREGWNAAHEIAQNAAIVEVHGRLGMGEYDLDVETWRCENKSRCDGNLDGTGACFSIQGLHSHSRAISHRLATFTHRATGIEFQLLPGTLAKEEPVRHRVINDAMEIDNTTHESFQALVYCGDELVADVSIASLSSLIIPLHYGWRGDDGYRVFRRMGRNIAPFLIARYPVTEAQHVEMIRIRSGDSWVGPPKDRPLPIVGLAYKGCKVFASVIGARLPTSSEWEYACRAGTTTRYYWGDEFDPSHVWYSENSATCGKCPDGGYTSFCMEDHLEPHSHSPKTHDEASKFNAFGLVDMIGNVWEWVDGNNFVGGSFEESEPDGTNRGRIIGADHSIGFRPAMSIPGRA